MGPGSAARSWRVDARDRQRAAQAAVRNAAREIEQLPAGVDPARLARILGRLARTLDRLASQDIPRGKVGPYSTSDARRVVAGLLQGRDDRITR